MFCKLVCLFSWWTRSFVSFHVRGTIATIPMPGMAIVVTTKHFYYLHLASTCYISAKHAANNNSKSETPQVRPRFASFKIRGSHPYSGNMPMNPSFNVGKPWCFTARPKVSLLSRVYNHALWNKVGQLWKTSLAEPTSRHLKTLGWFVFGGFLK